MCHFQKIDDCMRLTFYLNEPLAQAWSKRTASTLYVDADSDVIAGESGCHNIFHVDLQ